MKKQALRVPSQRHRHAVGRGGSQGLQISADPWDVPEERGLMAVKKGKVADRVHVEMGGQESRKGILAAGRPI